MPFQFTCPQGHLLEGDESMANSQLNCPTCGMLFIVPEPIAPAAAPPPPEPAEPPAVEFPAPRVGAFAPAAAGEVKLLHIPCPQGHVLETPRDMLGLDVMCPHCGVPFRLVETESEEYKRRRTREQESQDRTVGNFWFTWAVAIAVIVVIGLVVLIATSGSR